MDVPVTLSLAVGLAAVAAFCGWRGARPPDLARGPRLVPWRFLMVTAAVGVVLLLVHLVNLAGFVTGGPRTPGG